MGWSASAAAYRTLDGWHRTCRAMSGQQNVYPAGQTRFALEIGRERQDGSIVGSVFDVDTGATRGRWRIDPDGTVSQSPYRWPGADPARHGGGDVRPREG